MRMAVMLEMVDSVLGRAEVRVGPEPAAMLNPSDWDSGPRALALRSGMADVRQQRGKQELPKKRFATLTPRCFTHDSVYAGTLMVSGLNTPPCY